MLRTFPPMTELRERLRAALKDAMRARDTIAVGAFRSTLGAVDNAESVDVDAVRTTSGPIAGATRGLGATEVPRKILDDAAIREIVQREIDERRSAADEYDALGRADEASRLRSEAHAIERTLQPT